MVALARPTRWNLASALLDPDHAVRSWTGAMIGLRRKHLQIPPHADVAQLVERFW